MKSLWHKIKILFVILIASVVSFGLFRLSTLADDNLLSKAKHETSLKQANDALELAEQGLFKTEPVSVPETELEALELELDDDSPEIDNSDYGWIQGRVDGCHPTMKNELRAAIKNDGMIRKNEYRAIMDRCLDFSEQESAGDKAELKRFLAE